MSRNYLKNAYQGIDKNNNLIINGKVQNNVKLTLTKGWGKYKKKITLYTTTENLTQEIEFLKNNEGYRLQSITPILK